MFPVVVAVVTLTCLGIALGSLGLTIYWTRVAVRESRRAALLRAQADVIRLFMRR